MSQSNKPFPLFIVLLVVILASTNALGAQYTIKQITDNSSDRNPAINNKGQVAFARYSGTDWDIYLYNNGPIIKISDNPFDDSNPDLDDGPAINDNGQIVWSGFDGAHWQIYSYLNGIIAKVTDGNHNEMGPLAVNNNGEIVWTRSTTNPLGPGEIYLYTEGNIVNFSHDEGSHLNMYPHINDYGDVVWNRSHGPVETVPAPLISSPKGPLFLWDLWEVVFCLHTSSQKQLITNDSKDNIKPRINNQGQIVYESGPAHPGNIQLYRNGAITPITTNNNNSSPDINDLAQIVWAGTLAPGGLEAIFLYDNGQTTKVTEYDNPPGNFPFIGNNGQFVFQGTFGLCKGIKKEPITCSDTFLLLLDPGK